MKTFLYTVTVSLVLGIIFFPTAGNYINEAPQREWCQKFEDRYEFSKAEAERYLNYCDHFDMKTQTEVKGRLVK